MDEYMGTVNLFAFNFVPKNWALCNGQLLTITSNSALYALIGTAYGGDGRTTFALPDLRNCIPIGVGARPGLNDYIEHATVNYRSSHGSGNFTTMGMNYCICIQGLFPSRE